jgi:hypothetical protein
LEFQLTGNGTVCIVCIKLNSTVHSLWFIVRSSWSIVNGQSSTINRKSAIVNQKSGGLLMSTDAQINANRENAQKSTGPVTAEGKAAVSQNAVKHGLFAVQDVVTTESQAEFDAMREQMLADLAPAGAVESVLAQRVISLVWRLKRAETMQTQAVEEMVESHIIHEQVSLGRQKPKDPRYAPEYLVLGRIAKRDWSASRLIERLFEYERRIENSLYKTIAKLRALQVMRQMANADAAEAQCRAQEQEKANSAKQSQSGTAKLPSEQLPQESDAAPTTLTSVVNRTCGDDSLLSAQAGLRQLDSSPARDSALPDGPKPLSGPQIQTSGDNKDIPLSLLKL